MKKWYKSLAAAEKDAKKENCEIVTGSNGGTDIYYLVPNNSKQGIVRVITRSQSDCKGKEYVYRVIYKKSSGELLCVDEASLHRINMIRDGRVDEDKIGSYLAGYYTLREETSEKIKQRKENARISHFLCTASGKAGHDERQAIRRELQNRKV